LAVGLPPEPVGELKLRSQAPYPQLWGTTSKGRDISIDWPQDGTTSSKYKAQWERKVPNSSHIISLRTETGHLSSKGDPYKHRKFFVLYGTQNGANLCLKCNKISLAAGLRPDLLWELKRSPRRPSRNQGVLLLRGLREGKGGGRKGKEGKG